MAESYLRQGPLDLYRSRTGSLVSADALAVAEPRAQLVLRGDPGSSVFAQAVRSVTGGAVLPSTPLSSATSGDCTLLWMGPDEWLLVAPDGRQDELSMALAEGLGDEHHAVADVSSSRTVIVLGGARAREVLMKGCSLDLHPSAFAAGRVDQCSLARCHVMLHLRDDTPTFDIYVHRSFAEYCWRWLTDAAAEYAAPGAA